ncbi:hypothetical protein Tco_0468795 [Tanacetum coccineum]
MSNMSEDIWYAGSDTRPPMLDRTDFESWQQRIRLYCLGKDNGENIMKSITEGPFQMGTFIQTPAEDAEETEGALQLGPERARVFTDLSAEEKERYKADIRATNILLQGIPKDIYTLINHYTDAKDIWDNVKMILEGSELTKDDRESQLYDEFERFCQIKGETIHVYYVRFSKLINDMRNIKMTMSRMQLNSKFVNNMLPEWSRFITEVKLNRGLKESNFDQLYAYLKQHEQTHPWCYEGGGGEEMEVVTVGWQRWRVEESGVGDRVDPEVGSVFGLRRKSPPEKFSGGGEWWPAVGGSPEKKGGEGECY